MADQSNRIAPKEVAGWGLVAVGGYLTFKLLRSLGILETKADKEKEAAEIAATARFDDYQKYSTDQGFLTVAQLYKDEQKKSLPSTGSTDLLLGKGWNERNRAIALKIYDSKATFNDDEDALYSAFRNLNTVIDMWSVNKFFQVKKQQNVFDYIREFTDDAERVKLSFILDENPYYVGNKR